MILKLSIRPPFSSLTPQAKMLTLNNDTLSTNIPFQREFELSIIEFRGLTLASFFFVEYANRQQLSTLKRIAWRGIMMAMSGVSEGAKYRD